MIVFGSSVTESVDRLKEVLVRFRGAGLKLKPSKCNLFQRKVHYLGHIVSENGIHTDPDKIDAIKDWPTPVSKKQVRSFLGTTGYYRRFVRDYAKVARPLTKLTKKNEIFEWSEECEIAFNTLKSAFISAPILAYPRDEGGYILDTDASNFAIGCVLSQVQDGVEKVIAYGSKALSKEERNYCVTRRELLAVVEFLKKYRHYLGGRPVTVRTDHSSLRWLFNFKNPEQQLARWLEVCASFTLTIEHRPGNRHQNADGLSCRPCKQCGRWDGWRAKAEAENMEAGVEAELMQRQFSSTRDIGIQTVPIMVCVEAIDVPSSERSFDDSCESEWETVSVNTCSELDSSTDIDDCSSTLRVQCIPEISLESLREAQLNDSSMSPLFEWKQQEQHPEWETVSDKSSALKTYWSQWDMIYSEWCSC